MFRDSIRENPGNSALVTGHPIVVGRTEGHDVMVRCEQPSTSELADIVLAFTLKGLCHLLGDDIATEHAREGIAHDAFKTPVKALYTAHGDSSSFARSFTLRSYLCAAGSALAILETPCGDALVVPLCQCGVIWLST